MNHIYQGLLLEIIRILSTEEYRKKYPERLFMVLELIKKKKKKKGPQHYEKIGWKKKLNKINTMGRTKKQKIEHIPGFYSTVPNEVITNIFLPFIEFEYLIKLKRLNKDYQNIINELFDWKQHFYRIYVKEFKKYFLDKFDIKDHKELENKLHLIYPTRFIQFDQKSSNINIIWQNNFKNFYIEMKRIKRKGMRLDDLYEQRDVFNDRDELYVFNILKYDCSYLEDIQTKNEKFLKGAYLVAIRYDSEAYLLIEDEKFKNDEEIALAAVRGNGYLYKNLGKEMQESRKIILEAVKNEGSVLCTVKRVQPRYLDDKEIATEAIMDDPVALDCCLSKFKEDIDFVSIAIGKNGMVIQYLPYEFYIKNYSREQLKTLFLLAGSQDIESLFYIFIFLSIIEKDIDFMTDAITPIIQKALLDKYHVMINVLAQVFNHWVGTSFLSKINIILKDLNLYEDVFNRSIIIGNK